MFDHFISEMAQKAAAVKRLEKSQRQAAQEAVKMAKRERGFYPIHIFIIWWHCTASANLNWCYECCSYRGFMKFFPLAAADGVIGHHQLTTGFRWLLVITFDS